MCLKKITNFGPKSFFFDEKNPKFEKKLKIFEKSCVFADGSPDIYELRMCIYNARICAPITVIL